MSTESSKVAGPWQPSPTARDVRMEERMRVDGADPMEEAAIVWAHSDDVWFYDAGDDDVYVRCASLDEAKAGADAKLLANGWVLR